MLKTYKQYNEKLGINRDGEILSDFLIEFLSDAKPDHVYLFVKPDEENVPKEKDNLLVIRGLPKFEKNIYKVYVNYPNLPKDPKTGKPIDTGVQAYFDPGNSKYTKNGYILYFTFYYKPEKDSIWKHHIYHEIHHGIQFLKMGKKKMIYIPKNIKVSLMRNIKKDAFKFPAYGQFIQLLYQSINVEQGAFIPQFYGKLKYRKNIKNLEDLKSYFKKRNIYEFRVANDLSKVNLNRLFSLKFINPTTKEEIKTDKNEMKLFFTIMKKLGKDISRFDNHKELSEYIQNTLSKCETAEDIIGKDGIISDDELKSTIEKYNKYFNKVGRNLTKKIDKTYALLSDYYQSKTDK